MKWFAIAVMMLVGCGSDTSPIVTVDVDSTQVVPAPNSLFLTLTSPDGERIEHTASVDADGITRIALETHGKSPKSATLTVAAFADRAIVAESAPQPVDLGKDGSLAITLD